MINLSAAVITPSRSSADDLIAQFGCDPKRMHVIPHGLAHDVFHPLGRTEAERRLEGVELPERFALYIGNIEPRKNIPTLLRAFEQPELASTDLGLVLAGRPAWNYGAILEAIDRTPRATYLGGVPREWLPALMSLASVFVFPSRYEGFGFPVLEAMAVGTPVITTRRGSLQEVADDAVLYVDPEDPHALARTIHEVVSDGEVGADLRARGLARAALFRWETSVTHHEHVLQEAVAEG